MNIRTLIQWQDQTNRRQIPKKLEPLAADIGKRLSNLYDDNHNVSRILWDMMNHLILLEKQKAHKNPPP